MHLEIAIELIVIFGIIGVVILWAIWHSISGRIAKKKYLKQTNNDKSRKGEEARTPTDTGRDNIPTITVEGFPRPEQSAERGDISPTDADSVGTDSKRFRGFFARRRR